jgi:hypothetical protein
MKQAFVIIFFFCTWTSFAQNTSVASDKRVFLPPLVVESTDPGKQEVNPSNAVPVTGQKYESSQQHTLMLVPIGNASGTNVNTNNGETLLMSETATPLPASASTTSQSNKLILIPDNTQKP